MIKGYILALPNTYWGTSQLFIQFAFCLPEYTGPTIHMDGVRVVPHEAVDKSAVHVFSSRKKAKHAKYQIIRARYFSRQRLLILEVKADYDENGVLKISG